MVKICVIAEECKILHGICIHCGILVRMVFLANRLLILWELLIPGRAQRKRFEEKRRYLKYLTHTDGIIASIAHLPEATEIYSVRHRSSHPPSPILQNRYSVAIYLSFKIWIKIYQVAVIWTETKSNPSFLKTGLFKEFKMRFYF